VKNVNGFFGICIILRLGGKMMETEIIKQDLYERLKRELHEGGRMDRDRGDYYYMERGELLHVKRGKTYICFPSVR